MTDDALMPPERANWSAATLFDEACKAADEAHKADDTRHDAVIRALCLTMRLIEHWRGEHRQEIVDFLGSHAPVDGADDVLPLVKYVYAHQNKKQWTWHANALRQAIAKGKAADDLTVYFKATSPTKAAQDWSKDHPRQSARKASGAAPVVLKLPFSAVLKAALFTDDKIRYAIVRQHRIDLQEVREKLLPQTQPAPKAATPRRKPAGQREPATA